MTYKYWARPDISIADDTAFFAGDGGQFPGFWAFLVSAGWSLVDTYSDYRVYSSNGEYGLQCPYYLKVSTTLVTSYCTYELYRHWDAGTHTGTGAAYGTGRIGVSSSSFNTYMYASKDFVIISSVIGTSGYTTYILRVVDYMPDVVRTTLSSGASSGSSVNLYIVGNPSLFETSRIYQILSVDSGDTEFFTCTGTGANYIVADSLSANYSADSWVGVSPRDVCHRDGSGIALHFLEYSGDTGDTSTNRTLTSVNYMLPDSMYWGFETVLQSRQLFNLNLARVPYTSHPVSSYYNVLLGNCSPEISMLAAEGTTTEKYCTYQTTTAEDADSGTSTGSNTSTTLNDTGKSWVTDEHAGKLVYCLGQLRAIASNTATELTISLAWDVTPTTDTYVICESAGRSIPTGWSRTVASTTVIWHFFLPETGV